MFYIKMWKVMWFIGYVLVQKVQDFYPPGSGLIPNQFWGTVLYLFVR